MKNKTQIDSGLVDLKTHSIAEELKEKPVLLNVPTKSGYEKWFIYVVLAVVFLLVIIGVIYFRFLFGQHQAGQITSDQVDKGKIVIGYTAWPGYVGLYLARDKGYFKDVGLDVELKKYDGFEALSNACKSGEIQGEATVVLEVISGTIKEHNHKVVVVVDHSNGADGIIATSNIKNIQDLKGKKIAFEHGTLGEFFTTYGFLQNNMTLEDVISVDLDGEKAAIALVNGEVDAATTYEPFLTSTLNQINGSKIYSSKDAPGLITDVLAFRGDFIDNSPLAIEKIVKAYFEGINFWKEHPDEANILIGKELGVSDDEVKTQLEDVSILSLEDNLSTFTFTAGYDSIYGNMRQIGRFIKEQKEFAELPEINTDSLVESRFIKNLIN